MKVFLLAVAVICVAECRADNLWCKDAEGNKVEWSLIYKLPKTTSNSSSPKRKSWSKRGNDGGAIYGYIDSRMIADGNKEFMMGEGSIFDEASNPLAMSLQPIFEWDQKKADKELAYIAYNDQPPEDEEKAPSSCGHTKGVVVFDKDSGIWLLHSVPKFPEKMFAGSFSFPKNAFVNGQTLLCMTFKSQALNTIATHLLNQKPHIFKGNAPESLKKDNPELSLLLKNASDYDVKEDVIKSTLQGIHGVPYLAFAKSGLLEDDVYSKSIAPALASDIYVSSWQNGEGGKLDSECSMKYEVLDVEDVKFEIGEYETSWKTEHDHSKWVVGTSTTKWLCIGSINRMRSQFQRGGETVCLSEDTLGKLFRSAVTKHSTCSKRKSEPKSESKSPEESKE